MDVVTLGLAALFLFARGAKKTAESLEFIPTDLAIRKKNGKNKLFLDVDVLNPTKRELKIESVFLSLFANNKKIGRIEKGEGFKIRSQGRTSVRLPVTISGAGLGKMIADWILKKKIEFKILGVVNAMGTANPVDEIVDFEM